MKTWRSPIATVTHDVTPTASRNLGYWLRCLPQTKKVFAKCRQRHLAETIYKTRFFMVAGRKPKAEHRHKVKPTHEWAEVPDVEFTGAPALPNKGFSQMVEDWWADISTMPHCVLWKKGDWRFAIETAYVCEAFHRGQPERAAELRIREKVMGTTLDARRDLRIRYIEPEKATKPASVTAIAEYRERLSG
jgi:hypothetical protein